MLLAATTSQAQPYLAALSKPGKAFIFDRNLDYFETAITIVSFVFGVGEIAVLSQGWKTVSTGTKIWKITNGVVSSLNLSLTNSEVSQFFIDKFEKPEEGKAALYYWNILTKSLDVISLKDFESILKISDDFTTFNSLWALFKGSCDTKSFTSEEQQIMEEIDKFVNNVNLEANGKQ